MRSSLPDAPHKWSSEVYNCSAIGTVTAATHPHGREYANRRHACQSDRHSPSAWGRDVRDVREEPAAPIRIESNSFRNSKL